MSDYIYMLESHLSPDQNRVVEEVQTAAAQANVNLFLTGGAMRDMLAGLRIRDLDFVVEGNALKVAKSICEGTGAHIVSADETRKSAELVFTSGVTAQIAMSRQEKYSRTGAKPQITQATLQEDLRGRDFTCNAIALSLNKASRGLLLDPMNGLADIERHELRAISTYGFYDDPSRLLRLVRFRVRLGFTVEERTRMQVANAREAEVEKLIPPRVLGEELKRIGTEDNPSEILKALDEAGLLALFSPALEGPKLNLPGVVRFEKNSRLLPDDSRARAARFGPFMYVLTEKLTPKEKPALIKATEMNKEEVDSWQKLESRSKKLETLLHATRIRKASHVYQIMVAAAPDEILFQLYHSPLKQVQERMRNYYQKYLPLLQEITPEEWATVEGQPDTPKYNKARDAFIANRLDRKVKKPEVPEVPPAPPPVPPPSSWSTPETALARRGRQG
jgi:tRNA nucleotidyltransferase (CCA-adding enzyme)